MFADGPDAAGNIHATAAASPLMMALHTTPPRRMRIRGDVGSAMRPS
jgi:hypothetical protein